MSADRLAVWLYGDWIATIVRDSGGRPRLRYTEEAFAKYELGVPLLTLALPLVDREYPQGVVRTFLDGLLPEGAAREVIATDLRLAPEDTFGLIEALGRDCAGALVIQPDGAVAPKRPTTRQAQRLDETELADLVRHLRSAPLGIGPKVRVSLGGVQEKLLLARMPDDRWGSPVDGTPSTHILKPEIRGYPGSVENEAFCMRVAKYLGFEVANVETTEIAGRRMIVVERYDRIVAADGTVVRVHQEDLCQAMGKHPREKYQVDGGPSLKAIADVLAPTVAVGAALERLLEATVLSVMLGNGDAHAKNFSLIHKDNGALQLAPLYDLMCTLAYGDEMLAMYIDDVRRTDRVTRDRIVNEAASWGMSRKRATELVGSVLGRAEEAIATAQAETPDLSSDVFDCVRSQVERLSAS